MNNDIQTPINNILDRQTQTPEEFERVIDAFLERSLRQMLQRYDFVYARLEDLRCELESHLDWPTWDLHYDEDGVPFGWLTDNELAEKCIKIMSDNMCSIGAEMFVVPENGPTSPALVALHTASGKVLLADVGES
tara:strand:- start:119 stop:523 length:405 start_codon:yes stop_codon:yes gene_type:complete